ncbi:MAG: adenylate/guanylate cyclase domain-containing protein [Anaerolineae bacterium]|nr:adenylate/guanylate cyclase domain-containing protein [Anaerolineae bacterium]
MTPDARNQANSAPAAPTRLLASLEPRLRTLLPADLYAVAWVDPSPATLQRVFEHLRTMQGILYDYLPRQVAETLPNPGEVRCAWQEGTLMFTDLAGFTPLMEANAASGRAGARTLLTILNDYFSTMIDIIGRSGGNLLEFTGDAMLVQFPTNARGDESAQAVRAGLRMQRAMQRFAQIDTPAGKLSLGMRIGIHGGRFFTTEIGTPFRMEHALLGTSVQETKHAEGAGRVGRVNLTPTVHARVRDLFRFEEGNPGYLLVIDDLSTQQLGEYEFAPGGKRLPRALLMDRSVEGLLAEIESVIKVVEPLASYLPRAVLNLVVENAARRQIPPDFPAPTVIFVNLIGLPESVDHVRPEEEVGLATSFSRIFGQINAAVESRGGVLKKVTCHLSGSDMMILFGVPSAHTDDPLRAASAALAIRGVVDNIKPPVVGGSPVSVHCQIGVSRGPVFSAEIGETRGRREFNVLGDTVNTAARLMGKAGKNQILMTEDVYREIAARMDCEPLGEMPLKGKAQPVPIFALRGPLAD